MEQEIDIASDVGTPPEQEGIPINEGEGEQAPPRNILITDLQTPLVVEKPSTLNTFSIGTSPSSGLVFNQPSPEDPVMNMFGSFAPLQSTTLGQYISEFGSMSATQAPSMNLTPH